MFFLRILGTTSLNKSYVVVCEYFKPIYKITYRMSPLDLPPKAKECLKHAAFLPGSKGISATALVSYARTRH